ncbi:MAG: nicotinate-nucleotide diphosphorylase (carboxylating) [Candidatus Thorarchaeota archaeon]|nr:MAG: nicotinate-nucleotide diphosphorylase (carboxylating) [Candidatus Thorarchaeota archaeon]
MSRLPPEIIETLKRYIAEDVRSGDLTTELTIPADKTAIATIYARENAVLAGIEEIAAIAEFSGLTHEILAFEGNWVSPQDPVMRLKGNARTLLTIERVCLNIIQRMSGIATKTYKMVSSAREVNPSIRIACTRKTTPGFRFFEKRAVIVGGGDPHRYALDDMILIKNNHITIAGGVHAAVTAAREAVSFSKKISCEARTLQEVEEAIGAGADIILLDNFKPKDIGGVIEVLEHKGLRKKVILEVSGGVNEENVRDYARYRIDVISSGALTHSYNAADFNMRLSLN